jgi:hypothetical protein
MSARKAVKRAVKKGLSDRWLAILHGLAAMTWVVLAYIYGNEWKMPGFTLREVFLGLSPLVMVVLWFIHAKRNPEAPTLTEGVLAFVFLVAVFLREWSDPPNGRMMQQVSSAGMALGLLWWGKCVAQGYTAVKFGWYDIVAGVTVIGVPVAWMIHTLRGEGSAGTLFVLTIPLLMLFFPAVTLRCLIAISVDWIRKGTGLVRVATLANWMVFPLVAGLVYGYGKSVSSLKIHFYSTCLLAASDKFPSGIHGKMSAFKNTDKPFLRAKGIPVYGLQKNKTKDIEVFVTGVDGKGVTYAYVHAPDGNAPKAGKDQVVRRLWSHWWRLEPKDPARF